jgi:hypothetical protein
MEKFERPRLLSESELNTIRGKSIVGKASTVEIAKVFGHIDSLEMKLDEAEDEDCFGPEGWRHKFGVPGLDD